MKRNKVFRYHPYRNIAIGIMIPPFSSTAVDGFRDEYLEALETRYPIVVSEWYIDNIDKTIVFVPRSIAYDICKPVRLSYTYVERDNGIFVKYELCNGLKPYFAGVATHALAVVSVVEIRKYVSRKCFDEAIASDVSRNILTMDCSYLVASKVEIVSKLSTNNIAFLKKLVPGTEIRLKRINIAVDGHPKGIEELARQITFSVRSLRYPAIAEITSVVAYPLSSIFINATNAAIPLSNDYHYTVARIGYGDAHDLLLVIAWDVDVSNLDTLSLPPFNVIELMRFAGHDIL